MQIIDKGCGSKIKDGETVNVLCRFDEYNLLTDSLQYSNNNLYYAAMVDKMSVRNTSGTFTASFDTGSSVMYLVNSSTSVPSGWLVPFTYVNIGRPKLESDKIAKVKLIVPSAQGTLPGFSQRLSMFICSDFSKRKITAFKYYNIVI